MTALLVDGNNVLMRAVHAMQRPGQARLSSDSGVPTGPLLAFINSLSKHVREEQPDKVVVAWDGGKSAHRVALDPDYKGQRTPAPEFEEYKEGAFALAKEFLSLANVHHVEVRGYEADDVIAYYWRYNRPLDEKVVILSSDKDFLQLLGDGIEQVRLGSYDTPTDRWTRQRVLDEMGCDPRYLADAMALAGDTSDNIPGVPRFGMRTAVKTLARNKWDLDIALNFEERLQDHRERVSLNRQLVDLREGHQGLTLDPLPPFQPTGPGNLAFAPLLSFLTRYQLESVKARLYNNSLWK